VQGKTLKVWNFTETGRKKISQLNLSEAKIKAKRLKTSKRGLLPKRKIMAKVKSSLKWL
jgi:hypothetical protein